MNYLDNLGGFRGDLARYARDIVRAAGQKQKPSNQRIRGFQDSALPTLEQRLFSTAPIYKSLEQALLAESLAEMQDVLGADNADVKKALAGKTPDERAKELIDGTKLEDVAVRKQLYEGGEAAVEASNDPLIVLMRQIEPDALAVHQRDEDEVQSVLRRDGGYIGKALFAKEGLKRSSRRDLYVTSELRRRRRLQAERQERAVVYHHGRSLHSCRRSRQQASVPASR